MWGVQGWWGGVLTTVGEIDDRHHAAREERVEFVVAGFRFYHFAGVARYAAECVNMSRV